MAKKNNNYNEELTSIEDIQTETIDKLFSRIDELTYKMKSLESKSSNLKFSQDFTQYIMMGIILIFFIAIIGWDNLKV